MIPLRKLGWFPSVLIFAASLSAQGVATAAIEGRITTPDGRPIPSAIVTLRNSANGAVSRTTSRSTGRYSIEHLTVGGPYVVQAKAIGFDPVSRANVFLSLGERVSIDFTVARSVTTLAPLVVTSAPAAARADNGGATVVAQSTVRGLPSRGRDVFQLSLLSPQAVKTRTGGMSVAGQPDRLNALQIDGATNNDLFGNSSLGLVGAPGQGRGARTLSPEAVEQLEVITSRFDVRYGNFAGALVNAVTRSGTNKFGGSLSSWYSSSRLIGEDPSGGAVNDYETREIDLTVSGPIIKDHLAFFVDAGLQRAFVAQPVAMIGADTTSGRDSAETGIRRQSVTRLQDILSRRYGVDAGSGDPFPTGGRPANLFAKVTWRPAMNNYIELSQNFARNSAQVLTFVPTFTCRRRGFYCLTSRSFDIPVNVNATRAAWIASTSTGVENEFRAARLDQINRCLPATNYPGIIVAADAGRLAAGSADFCSGSFLRERLLEFTDNLTLAVASHRLTFGAHAERVRVTGIEGQLYRLHTTWFFNSLDSLEAGLPSRFETTFRDPASADDPMWNIGVTQVGLYGQDEWKLHNLTVTAGLRIDVPYLDRRPAHNSALIETLGTDNTVTPTGNMLLSPRFSWSLPLASHKRLAFRGGVGVFAGRPPYKWFEEVFAHTGREALAVVCVGQAIPTFTLDAANQPRSCGQVATAFVPFTSLFARTFRFPRNLKLSLGLDLQLPDGLTGTLDFLETRGLNQYALRDLNLSASLTAAGGEGGRAMYGSINAVSGAARPARPSNRFGPVVEVRNASGDRARAISFQMMKRTSHGTEFRAFYAHTVSRDRFSAVRDRTDEDMGSVVVAGTMDNRQLTTSAWSVPNKVGVSTVVQLPARFSAGLFYSGTSGNPFTYVVRGDANADGFGDAVNGRELFNDAVYVPRDASDIALVDPASYEQLEKSIANDGCLRRSRGALLERNSCRNGWVNTLDARLSKTFNAGSRSVELITDVFNIFSLLGSNLGEVKEAVGGPLVPLLELTGYDSTHSRGIYKVLPMEKRVVALDQSRWRVQVGARFVF